jgi:hypothetical protein
MDKVTIDLKKGRLKVIKALAKIEYENRLNLDEFLAELIEIGIDDLIGNLTEEQGIAVIKDVAEQD